MKTLGMYWDKTTDALKFVGKPITIDKFTKRTVLSRIAMLYDPLGLAAAVTIKARMSLQDIWRLKELSWDDPLPDTMIEEWRLIFQELARLKDSELTRCLKPQDVNGPSELHVFSDASGKAYGAAAYLLWPTTSGPSVQLCLRRGVWHR